MSNTTPPTPAANAALEYTLTNDVLFKMLFKKHPDLLKRLVALSLGIPLESIHSFTVKNPEMPPDAMLEKFCRLDIVMEVDGRLVDLEVQVANKQNYRDRSLYNWARLFSSALPVGGDYTLLPPAIVISILAFNLFDCPEFHSEVGDLEVRRYERLTNKMALHYFELPKLPDIVDGSDELKLWLALFKAETEEELSNLITIGGPIMAQAISAYRSVSASGEFKELERLRARARHDEASALANARREGYHEADEKWQGVVAEKDTALAALAEQAAAHVAELAEQAAAHAAALAELETLRARLGE